VAIFVPIFEWLIMMLKLFTKLVQHQKIQNNSIQGSYMFLTTTSIFVRQVLLSLVALSYYQLKKFYCNFRQIIHTDWDTPTRFLSSCNNMICWWGRRNIIVAHTCRNIIEWKFFTLWFSLVEVGVELKMSLLNYWNIVEDGLWLVSYDHIGDVGIGIWLIEWVWLIELLN